MSDQKPGSAAVVDSNRINNHAAFIWSVANLLRGPYKPHEYGKVILPLTVLRRLDCVLQPTKAKVLERHAKLKGSIDNVSPVLEAVSGEQFYNTSPLDFHLLLDDPAQLAGNLRAYIAGFSSSAREIIEKFDFDSQITKLHDKNLLYLVVSKFADLDLHPKAVSNLEMGYMYEELIRRFSELSKEDAGDHYTPREVIRLMVNLLFIEDNDALTKPGTVRTVFDPACGTGGMLSVAEDYLRQLNPESHLEVFGQELNDETYAICRSDMMLKGQDASHITVGNSFDEDGHAGRTFDYCIANPPFGVEWKPVEQAVKAEADNLGFRGRFGAGLPRIDDSSLMFLQHMIAKMKPIEEGGSRIAVVFNGSPLFSGGAKSGESEIRRWIIENDWLEAVVALPDQLFYNTGISIYCWIVTNRKSDARRGKVQLVDSRELFTKMRKSLGEKRKEISTAQIEEITRLYAEFRDGQRVKIFSNEAFGYLHITVERPLRAEWRPAEFPKQLAEIGGEDWMRTDEPTITAALAKVPAQPNQKRAEAAIKKALPNLAAKQIKAIVGLVRVPADTIATDAKGQPEADPDLRDNENVPVPTVPVRWESDVTGRLAKSEYLTAVNNYIAAEVHPHVPDAWVDYERTKIGYEIPLTRHFYKYAPPRPLAVIDTEIQRLEIEIQGLLSTIELSRERREAIITASVAGSNADEPTDSGWVRWPVVPLKHLASIPITNGVGEAAEFDEPSWPRYVRTTDIAGPRTLRANTFKSLPPEIARRASLLQGDIVMTAAGATIGKSLLYGEKSEACYAGYLVRFRPKANIDGRFVAYWMESRHYWDQIATGKVVSTIENFSAGKYQNLSCPVPSTEMQREIADYLDNETNRIDALIAKVDTQVDLLKEHRHALITRAVTGELQVSG